MSLFLKNLLIVSLTLITQVSFARTILIQGPFTSENLYNDFLSSRENLISYAQHIQAQLQHNPAQENQLFKLSDIFNENPSQTIQSLKNIQSDKPLTLTSLRYIRDLTDKALQQRTSSVERLELTSYYCKSALLLDEGPLLYSCPKQQLSLSALKKQYPFINKVLVETVPFEVSGSPFFVISAQTAYQWTLLSNTHAPVHFFGTFQQLLNQQLKSETLIDGDCENFSYQNLEMEVLNEGLVFFSATCQKRIKPFEEKKSWVSENKNLLMITGGIIATGLLYNYTKGKKIVIGGTAFK